jgi:hypothetical protein
MPAFDTLLANHPFILLILSLLLAANYFLESEVIFLQSVCSLIYGRKTS